MGTIRHRALSVPSCWQWNGQRWDRRWDNMGWRPGYSAAAEHEGLRVTPGRLVITACLCVGLSYLHGSIKTPHRPHWPVYGDHNTTPAVLQGASQLNSSHCKMVWRVDRRAWRRCDELTVLFDPAFVAFKSFAIVDDFDIAHMKPK